MEKYKKKRKRKKWKQRRENVYNIERVINYKSAFLLSFGCFWLRGWSEIKQKMKPFGGIH